MSKPARVPSIEQLGEIISASKAFSRIVELANFYDGCKSPPGANQSFNLMGVNDALEKMDKALIPEGAEWASIRRSSTKVVGWPDDNQLLICIAGVQSILNSILAPGRLWDSGRWIPERPDVPESWGPFDPDSPRSYGNPHWPTGKPTREEVDEIRRLTTEMESILQAETGNSAGVIQSDASLDPIDALSALLPRFRAASARQPGSDIWVEAFETIGETLQSPLPVAATILFAGTAQLVNQPDDRRVAFLVLSASDNIERDAFVELALRGGACLASDWWMQRIGVRMVDDALTVWLAALLHYGTPERTSGKWVIRNLHLRSLQCALRAIDDARERGEAISEELTKAEAPGGPNLVLNAQDAHPEINGVQKPVLTPREYRVIKALADAKARGQPRLIGPELDEASNTAEARKVLKAMVKRDRDWRSIILFPKRKGLGYGLA